MIVVAWCDKSNLHFAEVECLADARVVAAIGVEGDSINEGLIDFRCTDVVCGVDDVDFEGV